MNNVGKGGGRVNVTSVWTWINFITFSQLHECQRQQEKIANKMHLKYLMTSLEQQSTSLNMHGAMDFNIERGLRLSACLGYVNFANLKSKQSRKVSVIQ